MKKLDKLIFQAFLGPFLLTLSVVIFIFLIQLILKYVDDIFGKGIEFHVYIQLFFYMALITLPTALPLSILMSSLIAFGNLGQHFELTAIKSAGISLLRAIFPIFIFVVVLSAALFVYNNTIYPWANLKTFSLLWDVSHKKPSMELKEGTFYKGIPNYHIKVAKKYPDGHSIKTVMIYDFSQGKGNTDLIVADSGYITTFGNDMYLSFELFNGTKYSEYQDGNNYVYAKKMIRSKFERTKMVLSLSSFALTRTDEKLFRSNRLMKDMPELYMAMDSMKEQVDSLTISTGQSLSHFHTYSLFPENNYDSSLNRKGGHQKNLYAYVMDSSQKAAIRNRAVNQARSIRNLSVNNLDTIKDVNKQINIHGIAFHQKITQTFTCLIFFLIGAPLGAIIRKGGLGVPVIITVFFFILYYILTMSSEKWAKESVAPPEYILWLANLVMLPVGFYFMKQARSDSRLFESDFYAVLWEKLIRFIKKEKVQR